MARPYLLCFGLSADPVHWGHWGVLEGAVRCLRGKGYQLHKVLLLPVFRRQAIGDKAFSDTPFEHRLKMCGLLAEELSDHLALGVEVSELERHLYQRTQNPNSSAETLSTLAQEYPQHPIVFVLGSDHVSGEQPPFEKWRQQERLLSLGELLVYRRKGFPWNEGYIDSLRARGVIVHCCEGDVAKVSSRELRQESAQKLARQVPESIYRYIRGQGLYLNEGCRSHALGCSARRG